MPHATVRLAQGRGRGDLWTGQGLSALLSRGLRPRPGALGVFSRASRTGSRVPCRLMPPRAEAPEDRWLCRAPRGSGGDGASRAQDQGQGSACGRFDLASSKTEQQDFLSL